MNQDAATQPWVTISIQNLKGLMNLLRQLRSTTIQETEESFLRMVKALDRKTLSEGLFTIPWTHVSISNSQIWGATWVNP